MYQKLFMGMVIVILFATSSYAYRIKNVKKHDGYIESIIACNNGKRTFVHKTDKGYYASTYKQYNTFEQAVKASCQDGNSTTPIEKKVFRLKHNAKVCKSIDAMERILDSVKAYHFSVSRECFTAMDNEKVEAFDSYQNGNLIDSYYKVIYDDQIHYIRSNDMHTNHNLAKKKSIKSTKLTHKKSKVKSTKHIKRKKITQKKKKRKKKKNVKIYHCSAKSKSAIGWANSTSISRAKKSAIHQCSIRSKPSDKCIIQQCTKR